MKHIVAGNTVEVLRPIYRADGPNREFILYASPGEQGIVREIVRGTYPSRCPWHVKIDTEREGKKVCFTLRITSVKKV